MTEKTKISMEVESTIWNRVMIYKIHRHLKDREIALEELILLGWRKYKEEKGEIYGDSENVKRK